MKTTLTKGLHEDAAKEVILAFKGSGILRDRIELLLKEKIDTLERTACNKVEYENPNWAYLKADETGYKRALYEVISLLK